MIKGVRNLFYNCRVNCRIRLGSFPIQFRLFLDVNQIVGSSTIIIPSSFCEEAERFFSAAEFTSNTIDGPVTVDFLSAEWTSTASR